MRGVSYSILQALTAFTVFACAAPLTSKFHAQSAHVQSVVRKETQSCAVNQVYDESSETCECVTKFPVWNGDKNYCVAKCPSFATRKGEECECDDDDLKWSATLFDCVANDDSLTTCESELSSSDCSSGLKFKRKEKCCTTESCEDDYPPCDEDTCCKSEPSTSPVRDYAQIESKQNMNTTSGYQGDHLETFINIEFVHLALSSKSLVHI
eukprot:CFRG3741T1